MKFDELNQLKRYFKVMELPEKDKEKRVSLGMLFYDAFFYVFLMMRTEVAVKLKETGDISKVMIDRDYYVQSLDYRIRDILEENDLPYEEEYIPRLTEDVIDTTTRHLDDDYYFSQERALLVAQNEANTVLNGVDFTQAKSNGKKYKTWITEGDTKVRLWHEEVDNLRVAIDEMFHVGNDELRFPHDYINGSAENLINCRCTCIYE